MTSFFREWKWRSVGSAGKLLIDLIFSTSEIESIGKDQALSRLIDSGGYIAAIWHSRILVFGYLYRHTPAAVLVSRSKDGELIARVLKSQGFDPVRGSTNRGGLRALAVLIKRVRRGQTAVITPDGPRGPRYRVQPGVITLAKKTGVPILPMTYSAAHRHVFASWDRFLLPRPFTRCRVVYGKPIYVPENAEHRSVENSRIQLESELRRITEAADRQFGHTTL
ncbi:MAG: lysophospholipid acyltransferase family protein [Desulfococcaceae bacterium]